MKHLLITIVALLMGGCGGEQQQAVDDPGLPLLIPCAACGEKVSKKAEKCLKCGHPTSVNVFKAKTLLALAQEEKSSLPSSLGQFPGLADRAEFPMPDVPNAERIDATLKSREFLKKFIEERKLLSLLLEPEQDEPTLENGFTILEEAIGFQVDEKTGLITLSVSWRDPESAAEWANGLVKQLNEKFRSEAIENSRKRIGYLKKELSKTTVKDVMEVLYSLLESEEQKAMLANVNEEFVLEVIDPAVPVGITEKP